MDALSGLDFLSGWGLTKAVSERLLARIDRAFSTLPFGFAIATPGAPDHLVGNGTPAFRIELADERALLTLAALDEGRIAEAYMDGAFDVKGDILKLFELRTYLTDRHPLSYAWRFVQPVLMGQVRTNREAIATHYEREPAFYLSFLDETRCYTQGIFERPDEPLATAIHRKFDFALSACKLGPGSRLLEVGPGWGAFTEYAARKGVQITAITISEQSKSFVEKLGRETGLDWDVELCDVLEYEPKERFDAVVLMGIMEHLPDYLTVLRRLQTMVKPGGTIYFDASAIRVKHSHSYFISRYIYPGNHTFMTIHDVLSAAAKTSLQIRGVHDDRESYFLTFQRWARRFEERRDFIVQRFGEREYRRFHLYLWGAAHCFLADRLQCYRVVLTNPEAPSPTVGSRDARARALPRTPAPGARADG